MNNASGSAKETPKVSRELIEYIKSKMFKLPYTPGQRYIEPQDIAFVYGQRSIVEHLIILHNNEGGNATIRNTENPISPSGDPGADPG